MQKAEHNKRINQEKKGQIRTVKLRALYLICLENTVPHQSNNQVVNITNVLFDNQNIFVDHINNIRNPLVFQY